jgi:lipoprotein-anchoring transpeptidase ErfK/SrfK
MRYKKPLTLSATALTLCLALTPAAWADVRSEAMAMLAKLRADGLAARFQLELRSLDATVATAEMYYQLSDQHNADRYYRLATQKGTLLLERMNVPPQPTPTWPPTQQTTPATEPSLPVPQPTVPPEPSAAVQNEPTQQLSAQEEAPFQSEKLVGTIGSYTVVKNDSLRLVAAKLGVNYRRLAAMNGLSPKSHLQVGQVLRYNNQRIIPASNLKHGIVINIPDRMLYYFEKGKLAYATAVALGTPTKMDDIPWHTPTGRFRIVNKAKDPTWTVPLSIQEEMRREGKEVITSVPPGADNPLGKYALRTSLPGILIHSTSKPWSIYTFASHGCVRVHPDRMEELFKVVKLNTPGEIIYQPVKVATTEEGRIFLEVHRDIYARTKGIEHEAKTLLQTVHDKVDWQKVRQALSRKTGVAEDVTLSCDDETQQELTALDAAQSPS